MNNLNQYPLLSPVLVSLKQSDTTSDQLWLDYASVWQQLGWQQVQVQLWLACLPEMATANVTRAVGDSSEPLDLTQHLVTLLEQAGKPLPISVLLKKLPAGVTATEQQLRKLAQQDARLEIKGPLLKRV